MILEQHTVHSKRTQCNKLLIYMGRDTTGWQSNTFTFRSESKFLMLLGHGLNFHLFKLGIFSLWANSRHSRVITFRLIWV